MKSRTCTQEGTICSFFEDGDLVGKIDYRGKSETYLEDAIINWLNYVMTVETVEKYSLWHNVKEE